MYTTRNKLGINRVTEKVRDKFAHSNASLRAFVASTLQVWNCEVMPGHIGKEEKKDKSLECFF